MTDAPAAADQTASTTQTRGFLFADIRGYTEFLEREGATAAAELLARYRADVRAAIAEQRGAEIRTEGDSFYVVMPSASAAVMCALGIVMRVDASNAANSSNRVQVGIGVHAGEAIDTDQGLVGSSINIAARLCSLAKPGEILVSETVRTLTRSVVPVGYTDRGRQKLKGVAEPVSVFAVVPKGSVPVGQSRSRRSWLVAGAVGAVVLVALGAVAYAGFGSRPEPTVPPSSSPGPSLATPSIVAVDATVSPTASVASPSPSPRCPALLKTPEFPPDLGGYPVLKSGSCGWTFGALRPVVSFTIDEAWTDRSWYPFLSGPDMGSVFVVRRGVDTGFNDRAALPASLLELDFVTPRVVLDDECNPTGKTTTLGGRTQDVIDWLSSARFLSVGDPQQVTVAGYSGVSVDVTVTGDPGLACGGAQIPGQGRAYLFNSSVLPPGFGGRHVIWDGEKARITALDVGGEAPLVIVARSREQDFDKVIPWATDLLDNTTVAPAP